MIPSQNTGFVGERKNPFGLTSLICDIERRNFLREQADDIEPLKCRPFDII
jgi:hypothetical protein